MAHRNAHKSIKVYSSPVHGKGVIATHPIRKGTPIIQYRGKIMTWEKALDVHPHNPDEPNHTFIFDLNNGYVIDAWYGNCAAKWLNHSCDPNVHAEISDGLLQPQVWLLAKRDIKIGEELCFDYGLEIEGEEITEELRKDYECRCGSPNCRGTMLSLAEKDDE